MKCLLVALVLVAGGCGSDGSQVSDSKWEPMVKSPMFTSGEGPLILIDEAHNNFHTAGEGYKPFADLLRKDGFRVLPSSCSFSADSLSRGAVLVISNALNKVNVDDWSLPTPSAFSTEEILAVRMWVEKGGTLLLIADHMPFPGAASDLARAFGFTLLNGFAMKPTLRGGADYFRRSDGQIGSHPITDGRDSTERIDSVLTFTGEAIIADCNSTTLLTFGPEMTCLMPKEAWQFDDVTPRISITGLCQIAVKEFGKGRVAVVGEAAMFTAQFAGDDHRPVGMNKPEANQNAQLLLNLMHWLTREL